MKLGRLGDPGTERPAVLDADGRWHDLSEHVGDISRAFLRADGLARLGDLDPSDLPLLPAGLRVGPPVPDPGKVVCIGLNYADHAAESGQPIPDEPIVFMKTPDTVVGPYDDVLIPLASKKTDYEVELAVVLGGRARYLESPEQARALVAGYAISNDVSEREFQLERGGQWDKGKCCETFNPLGPWLVTADEVPDPQSLRLSLRVNGEVRQDSSTEQMVFGVDHVIWYLSQFMVLEPGDIVNTGTPPGVALGMSEPGWLAPGDVMEVEISGLGAQRSVCRAAQR